MVVSAVLMLSVVAAKAAPLNRTTADAAAVRSTVLNMSFLHSQGVCDIRLIGRLPNTALAFSCRWRGPFGRRR